MYFNKIFDEKIQVIYEIHWNNELKMGNLVSEKKKVFYSFKTSYYVITKTANNQTNEELLLFLVFLVWFCLVFLCIGDYFMNAKNVPEILSSIFNLISFIGTSKMIKVLAFLYEHVLRLFSKFLSSTH
jgi:hypothetical protein